MKKSIALFLILLTAAGLCACRSEEQPLQTLPDNLGVSESESREEVFLPLTEEGETGEDTPPLTEEAPTEEETPQISQMDKNQVSNTYTYLKEIFGGGTYYLEYTAEYTEEHRRVKKEYVFASDGRILYIEDKDVDFVYLVDGLSVTVLNQKEKSYHIFDISGTEFSYANYIDWCDYQDYDRVEFVSVSAGTKNYPKLTETFTTPDRTISFYFYRQTLSTVSVTEADGREWIHTVKKINREPKASLFEVPEKYTEF